jgi:hypothetical protein
MTRRRGAAVLLAISIVSAACSGGGDGAPKGPVALDGTPRRPDSGGVIERAERDAVVIDGTRYRVPDTLQAFSTNTLQPVPLVGRVGQYVQFANSGRTLDWIAVFGAAATIPGRGRVTFYTGILEKIDGDDLVFEDGTVLRAGPDVDVPKRVVGERLNAEIDVGSDRVQTVTVAAS